MASRSGKDTLEYVKVRENFSCIIKALQSIHAARQQMRTKFIEKGWLSPTSKPTEDELVTQALGRIEIDVTQFPVFITILHEIQGMDQIVKKMTNDDIYNTSIGTLTDFDSNVEVTGKDTPTFSSGETATDIHSKEGTTWRKVPCNSPEGIGTQPNPTLSPLECYADYLRSYYSRHSLLTEDMLPNQIGKEYIELALIEKESMSESDAEKFTRLTHKSSVDQILKCKKQIQMEDILKEETIQLVVVEGAPGIGKSTLAWKICRMWPESKMLQHFSLVILIKLREEGVQEATTITDLLNHHDTVLCQSVGKEVEQREGEGVLLVFDGFDELPAKLRKRSLVVDLIKGRYLPKTTVLVTSRPSATAELKCYYKYIEVVGFAEKEILKYSANVLGLKNIENFKKYLFVNPLVKAMMYNPLHCVIILLVYQGERSYEPIRHTLTQLYTEVSLCLLSRYLEKNGQLLADELPNRLQDIADECLYKQLFLLGELAFEGRIENKVSFKKLPGGCHTLGLLNACEEMYGRKARTYHFLHLTLQDFLSAFYISRLQPRKQKELFLEYGDLKHMNLVWRFVAGLTAMKDIGWDMLEGRKVWVDNMMNGDYIGDRLDKGYEKRMRVVEVWPSVVQCLYEAQDQESIVHIFGKLKVIYSGHGCTTSYDVYALGYCMSASKNEWEVSLRWNGLGPEEVAMFLCGLNSSNRSSWSVKTLDLMENPIQNEGIVHFCKFPQGIQDLTTVNLSNCDLHQTGFDLLADIIPNFRHLQSLEISRNPGGKGSLVKLLYAIGKLEELEELTMVNIGISKDDITALSKILNPSATLKRLEVGSNSERYMADTSECVELLVKPSSLDELEVYVPNSEFPLQYVETISRSLTKLSFIAFSHGDMMVAGEGCSRFSAFLMENTTVEKLVLQLPLRKDEVYAIVKALEKNQTLKKLKLPKVYHSMYYSNGNEQVLDHRIKWKAT